MAVSAGYSGTPLPRKLGLRPGSRIAILHAPDGFNKAIEPLPHGVTMLSRLASDVDVLIFFTEQQKELRARFDRLVDSVRPDGMLWICWPKKASKRQTDLTEDRIRAIALEGGVVDVKVCAIDEVWSGLKLVRRTRDRAPTTR